MTDVLLITGPMNASQLGVPADADYKVVQVHPSGSDIGSTAYYNAMKSWIRQTGYDMSLRMRLLDEVPSPGKIGVAWFSAGHGAIKALLDEDLTQPSDVAAWMCLDGLYGSNQFAIDISRDAMTGATSLMATASTSTPGSYDHSLDRWRDVVDKALIPAADPSVATQWGLPAPDYCWGENACLVAGYEHLDHHHQVPAVREAMLRWWQAARWESPGKDDPTRLPSTVSGKTVGIGVAVASAALVGLAGWSVWQVAKGR